jgi:hypothetical protein
MPRWRQGPRNQRDISGLLYLAIELSLSAGSAMRKASLKSHSANR